MTDLSRPYDKILKENIERAFDFLMTDIVKIPYISVDPLPPLIKTGIERYPDLIKRVHLKDGSDLILHVEYQSSNDPEMAFRMIEYNGLLARKYREQIKQIVLYLKPDIPMAMADRLNLGFEFSFEIICLSDISYTLFLDAPNSEGILLGAFAGFGITKPLDALQSLMNALKKKTGDNEDAFRMYLDQFRILLNIRKFDKPLIENVIMEHFEKYFRAENDLYYQYGEIKGEEKGELKGEIKGEIRGEIKANETTALKMIRKGLNLQLIQEITGLTPERLAEIQKGASAD